MTADQNGPRIPGGLGGSTSTSQREARTRKPQDGEEDRDGRDDRDAHHIRDKLRGQVTKQTDASGAVTDYVYDTQGNLQSVTGPANNTLGTRPVTSYTYDGLGRVQTVTDPESRVTSYTYDAQGRILTVTLPQVSGRTFTE